MEVFRYVIVGGGLAGGRACDGIRDVDPAGAIALVTEEEHLPYQRPPLSKGYLKGKQGLDRVYLKDLAYYEQRGVELIMATRAEHVDPLACTMVLADGREIGYERLLLATGGRARRLPLPGNNLAGVFGLRTIEDSDAIRQMAADTESALVLGGSFLGAETAASLCEMGLSVTMAFPESRLLERIAPEALSKTLEQMYAEHGVQINPGTVADRLEGEGRVQRAVLSDGQTLDVDMVVMGVGIELNTALAQDAGLPLDESGAVLVDEYLRTQDPSIYAAGDIASWPDACFNKRLRVEHWDVARAQGLHAGRCMAGELAPYTTLPYFFCDMFDFSFEAWGDVTEWDRIVQRGSIEGRSFALYFFRKGQAVGVIASGRPDQERGPMENVVKARMDYEEVAYELRNEASSLEVFAG